MPVNVNVKVNETSDSGKREVQGERIEDSGLGIGEVGGRKSVVRDQGVTGGESRVAGDSPSAAKGAKPTAGISFGPVFSTASEVADCGFRDLPIGILGGQDQMQGQAEVCVRRCHFERCGQGILLQNWNSLDWWVWDSVFEDCGQAISNDPGCGNYNAYRNLFLRSKSVDLKINNLGGFGFVENVSKGSGMFLSSNPHTAGANILLQGNRITREGWDKQRPDSAILYIGQPGPVLILDNHLQRANDAPGPEIYLGPGNRTKPSGSALLMGNTTTVEANSLVTKGTFDVRLADAKEGQRSLEVAEMPAEGEDRRDGLVTKVTFPTNVVEVKPGAEGEDLQAALDGAPNGSVVHLPSGTYTLDRPLVVPGCKRLTLRGDGFIFSTCLQASRDFEGEALVICQPTDGLILQDLQMAGPLAGGAPAGLLIRVADGPGVAVHGDQAYNLGFGPGLVVEGLDEARVVLENHQHNGVTVFGGPRLAKGEAVPGRVEFLQGASSRDKNLKPETPIYDVRQGGRIFVRDIWYEGHPPEFLQVRDRGDIVFVGGHVAPKKGGGHAGVDAIQMNGKGGSVLLAQAALNGADLTIGKLAEGFFVTLFGLTPYPETRISYGDPSSGRSEIRVADSSLSKSLSLSCETDSKTPGFVQMMCRQNNLKITGSEALPDVNAGGNIADRFQILRDWKLPEPGLPAKVRLHRVRAEGGVGMVVVRAAVKEKKGE